MVVYMDPLGFKVPWWVLVGFRVLVHFIRGARRDFPSPELRQTLSRKPGLSPELDGTGFWSTIL